MKVLRLCVMVTGLVLTTNTAHAASSRSAEGGGANPQLQRMVQQLTLEKSRLQAENDSLKTEIEGLSEDLEALQKKQKDSTAELKSVKSKLNLEERESNAYAEQNQSLRDGLQELSDRYRQLAELLAKVEAQREELTQISRDYDTRVVTCERNNENLFVMVGELIDKYERKGFFRSLREREPFIQMSRVEVENMMDEYAYLAEEMRLKFGDEFAALSNDSDTNDIRPDANK